MTIQKILQKYSASIVAFIGFILIYKFDIGSHLSMDKIMDKSVDLSSISFGFLLAVLAIILQGDTPSISRIRSSGNFNTLISLNKKAVLACGTVLIIALAYIGTDIVNLKLIYLEKDVKKIIDTISLSIILYQILAVYSFLNIFYLIIKE